MKLSHYIFSLTFKIVEGIGEMPEYIIGKVSFEKTALLLNT
jgi:hypothetical protein